VSDKLRSRIGNCDNVDSIAWDPHKALVVPLQATFFLCRHPGLMEKSNSTKADYLFHKERNSYDGSLDTGDRSLQCGRVIDILKVWTYLKGNGWKEIARHV
jgi:glutamate/tyrosine decarboxylase-like PLP-dependent enzyme